MSVEKSVKSELDNEEDRFVVLVSETDLRFLCEFNFTLMEGEWVIFIRGESISSEVAFRL